MRNLRLGITLVALSVLILVAGRLQPTSWFESIPYANTTFGNVIAGLFFYLATYFLGLQSLAYFRLPRMSLKTLFALFIASIFIVGEITTSDNVRMSTQETVMGIIFLLSIGYTEEIFSRAFIFGSLFRFGRKKAIFFSSLGFGLMHLNRYTGSDWDPWVAYWHVMDTFGFGIFICALMILTRSIWVAVIFHALVDWSIVFDKYVPPTPEKDQWQPSMWEGLTSPLFNFVIFVGLAAMLLAIDRGSVPKWVKRVALKWKLVEPDIGLAYPL
jgi:membrane protease YdiL (CAAX protease family)